MTTTGEPTAELVEMLASLATPQRFMVAALINLMRGMLELGDTRESLVYVIDVLIRDMDAEHNV